MRRWLGACRLQLTTTPEGKSKEMQKQNIRGKPSSSCFYQCRILGKKEFTISQLRQAVAEARGLKPTGFGKRPNKEGCTQAISQSTEKERVGLLNLSMKKKRKRKTEVIAEKCYGCGQLGHFIANCTVAICFCCDGEGHRAPECP